MGFRNISKIWQLHNRKRSPSIFSVTTRPLSHFSSQSAGAQFGIAFDIDGVVLRGITPIGDSPSALRKLYDDSGTLKIPYVFLTNGGGFRESKRASELSDLLGVKISPLQVLQGHSPFKQLVNRFENELVVAVGKGEPATVMSVYGFKKVISLDDYANCFDNIDPLAPYKKWNIEICEEPEGNSTSAKDMSWKKNICSERVQAAFVLSDSIDWSRDIQVLCDVLRTGGLPGRQIAHQPHLYFAHDDLEYQAAFPCERFGLGAFRIALESIFNVIHPHALKYTCFGKPNPLVFKNAENALKQVGHCQHFQRMYMIGDNPSVDINGAMQFHDYKNKDVLYFASYAGRPWFSILTRTGVFKGEANHPEFPANLVVDTVKDAVDFILRKEGMP